MADYQHRKYLLTINNPEEHGFDRQHIKDTLATLNPTYYCISDEIGLVGQTPHTHIFLFRKSAIRESTIRRKFPDVHMDFCTGTSKQNMEYVSKTGKWANDAKSETVVPGSFEEFGEIPTEREEKSPEMNDIIAEVESGKSTADIIRDNPRFLFKTNEIDTLRQTLNSEKYLNSYREVTVIYLYGATGAGKSSYVFKQHTPHDVCRITSYGSSNTGVRFDAYHGQKILVFEEFHAQIPLPDLLNYLDRYPVMLPAQYSDRVACFDTVYIVSNLSIDQQYIGYREHNLGVWQAFLRRISAIYEVQKGGVLVEHSKEEF